MTNPIILDISRMFAAIPQDTARALLPELLRPIFDLIIDLDEPTQMAIIHHEIKNYFSLTVPEAKSYEKLLKSLIKQKDWADEPQKTGDIERLSLIDNLIHWTRNAEGKIKYLLDVDGKMEIKETVVIDGQTYEPKQDIRGFVLPDESIITENHDFNNPETGKKLLADIEQFIYDFVQLPGDKYYLILALWALHTYLLDQLESSPFLYMFGTKETGKSRAGKIMAAIGFRCKRMTNPTGPVIYRNTTYLKTNYVFDEIQLLGKSANSDVVNLLKNRYTPDCTTDRILTEIAKKPIDQLTEFTSYGATMLSTTENIDNIVESRCLKFNMEQNDDKRKNVESNLDKARAAKLVGRMTHFRHYWMNKELPKIKLPGIVEPRRRLAELLTPLYIMLQICDPDNELNQKEWLEFTDFMITKRKQSDSQSYEAEVIQAVWDTVKNQNENFFFADDVTKIFNCKPNMQEYEKKNSKQIGRMIGKLNFKPFKHKHKHGWILDLDHLKKKMSDYDIDITLETTNLPFPE
jgi:hypothetical protein